MTISELAMAAGVAVPTIRYYERRGIVPRATRSASGYRQYTAETVQRVRFVKRAQELGFSLHEIQELLALRVEDKAACAAVEQSARAKIDQVEEKIRDLSRIQHALEQLASACRAREATDECPILCALEEARRA